jgi:LmbE family N-acetylglucosaminyl deacetylase
MRLDFSNERILAVVAHPDDAEYLCAGTLARAKGDGAAMGICVLCRGDKGQPDPPIDDLGSVRREEMAAAAKLLGAELLWAGFGDGELADGVEARKQLVELYRQFEPTLVLAHSADDYHADHRAASSLAEAASWFATSAGHKTASEPLGAQPAVWWMDTVNMTGFAPHFYVDISEHVELKRRMLGCHRSQLVRGSGGDFSPLEEQMVRQSRARGSQAGVEAAEAFRLHHAWKRLRAW